MATLRQMPTRSALPGSVEDLLHRVARPAARHRLAVTDRSDTASRRRSDRQQPTVEWLSQLYDAILADRRLPRESLPLLSRLYPAVLRQTLLDRQPFGRRQPSSVAFHGPSRIPDANLRGR